MADRSGWTQRRLQNTEAYLRHVVDEGSRKIYDAEEYRLLLLDVREEIARRKAQGTWATRPAGGEDNNSVHGQE